MLTKGSGLRAGSMAALPKGSNLAVMGK